MNSAHLEMRPPISRKHTFCQPAATPELEAELFPSGSFFPTATKSLTCIVQEPGHLGHRTVELCIAQVSGKPQCLIYMHVLALLTCMASRSPGAGRYDVQKSAKARPLFSRFASPGHRQLRTAAFSNTMVQHFGNLPVRDRPCQDLHRI